MIPFRVHYQPGASLFEQTVYAARKAMIAGQLRPGDPFPSVRSLSKELKINPNTAHKVVAYLIAEGLLEPYPGVGTVVAQPPNASRAQRTDLLEGQVEALIVDAKGLGLSLGEVQDAVALHWDRLGAPAGTNESADKKSSRSKEDV